MVPNQVFIGITPNPTRYNENDNLRPISKFLNTEYVVPKGEDNKQESKK